MILKEKEDFQDAILAGKEVKTKTVFYTDYLEEKKEIYQVGDKLNGGIIASIIYNKPLIIALKDLNKKYTFEESQKKCPKGYRVPTQKELMLIYINKDVINKALIENGGEPLEDDWYWSSSEYDNFNAWSIRFSDGSVDWYYKFYSYPYVRPVLAF